MRPGIPTLTTGLLFLASLAYAPTWASITLGVLAAIAASAEVARYRRSQTR